LVGVAVWETVYFVKANPKTFFGIAGIGYIYAILGSAP
jgi:hypothetical protein